MVGTKKYLGAGVLAIIAFLLLSATFSFAETITNTYDELNRLKSSTFGSRFVINYSYDDFGNRIYKTIDMSDRSAPATTIGTKPGIFSTASVTFTFTSEANVTFGCQLDGGDWVACNSGTMSYDGLTEAIHTFNVKATDRSGNTDATPASHTWTVDTTPPDTNITTHPLSLTNLTTANFTFTSSEPTNATFQCQLDSGSWTACYSGRTYYGFANGSHTFNVKAADAAGNTDTSPASYTWTVDATAPDTNITAKPANPTTINTASFSFTSTEDGSTFQCQLDSFAWAACNDGLASYSNLLDGSHSFNVKATDTAGNTDASPATFTWTVDTIAPDTTITVKPANPTNSNTASFRFIATEAGSTFQCQLDSGTWTVCNSGVTLYSSLSTGSHTFNVKATDTVGYTDATPASYTWTVDTTPPDTTITGQPASLTNLTTVSFTFTSSKPTNATFQCQLDSGSWTACNSGAATYSSLPTGSHTFNVKATDAAGNTDPTPASYTWTIDVIAPLSSVIAPHNGSGIINNSFTIIGMASDVGSSVSRVEISINNGAWTEVTGTTLWSYDWPIPSEGTYTIQSRSTDAVGNIESPGAGITVHAYNRTASNVTVSGRQLLVNGSPFTVKGVNYSPVPAGETPETAPYGDYFTAVYSGIYDRDLPLIREMGANVIRLMTWDNTADHSDFLDKAYNGGVNPIYVIAGFWINAGLDISQANVREQIKADFSEMVMMHNDHPAMLMWAIGSDLNASDLYGTDKSNLFSLIEEMAAEAHAIDPDHQVMTPLADEDLIATISAYNTSVPSLDIWGANIYRGDSFGTLFSDYSTASGKPFLITEYGIDAYSVSNTAEDQANQSQYAGALWNEIADNSATTVGGVYKEYSDQWWSGSQSLDTGCPEVNNSNVHGTCGEENTGFPDSYDNFEWWGLMSITENGSNPDIVASRAAYNTLQSIWRGVFILGVRLEGSGSGTVTSSPLGINCGTVCSELFSKGSTVMLTAAPGANVTFTGWSGDCSGTINPLDVLVDRAKNCTATFTIITHTVTPSAGANGSLTPGTAQTVNHNATTSFTVTANTGYRIATVSGCGGTWTGSNPYTTGPITADCTVSATFTLDRYTLTVNKTGAGSGTVTSFPQGINCGTDCTQIYNAGFAVTLTASSSEFDFTGWVGGGCSGKGPCTLTMNADATVNAGFAKAWFDQTDPAITYSGTWTSLSCVSCYGGSIKYSLTSASATFSFNGTGISWWTARNSNLGIATLYMDGVFAGSIDLYSSTMQYQVEVPVTGLAAGNHTAVIEVSGQKNASSSGYKIMLDAVEVIP